MIKTFQKKVVGGLSKNPRKHSYTNRTYLSEKQQQEKIIEK